MSARIEAVYQNAGTDLVALEVSDEGGTRFLAVDASGQVNRFEYLEGDASWVQLCWMTS